MALKLINNNINIRSFKILIIKRTYVYCSYQHFQFKQDISSECREEYLPLL